MHVSLYAGDEMKMEKKYGDPYCPTLCKGDMSHYLLLVVLGRSKVLSQHMKTHQGRKQVLPEVDQVWAALYEKRKNKTNNNSNSNNTQSKIPTN